MRAWLFGCAGLTVGMVSVGGYTRLTESGLSITEWKPVTGALPPLSSSEWAAEFERYRASPEYRQLRDASSFGEADFRRIYLWEWSHRALARLLGVAYALPWLYFVARGRIRGTLLLQTSALFALGGAQGAIGWWMVRSGLDDDLEVPRVSHYRLATHLGSALVIYSSLMWLGLNVATKGKALAASVPPPGWLRPVSVGAMGLVFGTAVSGALVAGRDAGLIYGHTVIIPAEERKRDYDARLQWNHRMLGITTALSLWTLSAIAFRLPLPARTRRFAISMAGMALVQASLGVATLYTVVNTHVAAAHQLGSVLLLTTVLHFAHDMKRLVKGKV